MKKPDRLCELVVLTRNNHIEGRIIQNQDAKIILTTEEKYEKNIKSEFGEIYNFSYTYGKFIVPRSKNLLKKIQTSDTIKNKNIWLIGLIDLEYKNDFECFLMKNKIMNNLGIDSFLKVYSFPWEKK